MAIKENHKYTYTEVFFYRRQRKLKAWKETKENLKKHIKQKLVPMEILLENEDPPRK